MNDLHFRNELLLCLQELLEEDETADIRTVTKNNGVRMGGLTILKEGRNASPTFFLPDLKREYEKGRTLTDISRDVLRFSRERSYRIDLVPARLRDYTLYKDRVFYKLCNYAKNEELLRTCPHRIFLDLALVCMYPFRVAEDLTGSILVQEDDLERWEIDRDRLFQDALRNTRENYPPVILPLCQALNDLLEKAAPGLQPPERYYLEDPTGATVLVLTNEQGIYGASAILYDGLLAAEAERAGYDLFVIPSSLHEVLLYPDNGFIGADDITDMIGEINRKELDEKDVLSDHVYRFRRETGLLEMA